MNERCEPCTTGRRDGKVCDLETCRCRCHREGKAAVDALSDASLDAARAVGRTRKIGPNQWLMTVPLKDIMKEDDQK